MIKMRLKNGTEVVLHVLESGVGGIWDKNNENPLIVTLKSNPQASIEL
jgi:hypothetical protein